VPLSPPAPVVWTAGSFPQPADFNTNIRDALNFTLAKTVLRARQSVAQSIPNNTGTILTLDTLIEDTYSGWTSGASNKYTAQADGLYLVSLTYVSTGGNGAGSVISPFLQVTGSAFYQGEQAATPSLTNWATGACWILPLRGGVDYVQPQAFQLSGAALNTVASSLGTASAMEIEWLSN
jgi:hypothetical protein